MPESKGRAKPRLHPAPCGAEGQGRQPAWFVPVMLGLMVVGLLWIVTFYITGPALPDPGDRPLEPRRRLRPDAHRLRDDHPLALSLRRSGLSTGVVPTGDE